MTSSIQGELALEVSTPSTFNFHNRYPVRVIMRDGEPWFVVADVCRALNIDSTAIRKLDDDERGLHLMQTLGG